MVLSRPVDPADGSATTGFPHDYAVVIDPELPPAGSWACPFAAYDRNGVAAPDGMARWGAGLQMLVQPASGPEWVATFPPGDAGPDAVFATPSPGHACALARGTAHLVAVGEPAAVAPVLLDRVHQVTFSIDPALLLLVSDHGLAAVGPDGLAWRAEGWLGLDDVRVRAAETLAIRCTGTGWDDSEVEFVLDPGTGRLVVEPPAPPWADPRRVERPGHDWWRRLRRHR